METHEVLLRPVISEKSTVLHDESRNPRPRGPIKPNRRGEQPRQKYVFAVSREANKIEIRRAVEDQFRVKVASVRTITMPAKEKGAGYISINKRRRGHTTPWKKAIVTLQPGERIADFFGEL